MPRWMDGYLVLNRDGHSFSVRFAGETYGTAFTETEGLALIRELADGRALWRFTGETHVPLEIN